MLTRLYHTDDELTDFHSKLDFQMDLLKSTFGKCIVVKRIFVNLYAKGSIIHIKLPS